MVNFFYTSIYRLYYYGQDLSIFIKYDAYISGTYKIKDKSADVIVNSMINFAYMETDGCCFAFNNKDKEIEFLLKHSELLINAEYFNKNIMYPKDIINNNNA